MCGIITKLVQRRIQNKKKIFLFFFEELSRIEVLCEHGIFVHSKCDFSSN